MVISRNLDLVSQSALLCHQKKFQPLFFGRCESRLLEEEGRVCLTAWCERRRCVCVVHEVSMCRGDRGEFAHVCIGGCDVYLVGRVMFSPLSSLCFAGLCT
jgi:hypothetical protein